VSKILPVLRQRWQLLVRRISQRLRLLVFSYSFSIVSRKESKEALLKIHSPYILHFATHGFFAKADPTSAKTEAESSLNDRQSTTKSKFFKNPMYRSGLSFGRRPNHG
jgi:hypothetical protein